LRCGSCLESTVPDCAAVPNENTDAKKFNDREFSKHRAM
jgi:hypothetical protein